MNDEDLPSLVETAYLILLIRYGLARAIFFLGEALPDKDSDAG